MSSLNDGGGRSNSYSWTYTVQEIWVLIYLTYLIFQINYAHVHANKSPEIFVLREITVAILVKYQFVKFVLFPTFRRMKQMVINFQGYAEAIIQEIQPESLIFP